MSNSALSRRRGRGLSHTVIDRKESHGTIYLVTDGGLHHQLAASGNFGTVVRRNYPSAIATRYKAEPTEEVNIVGCPVHPAPTGLPMPLPMPRAGVGDLVAVVLCRGLRRERQSGELSGHGPAAELLV